MKEIYRYFKIDHRFIAFLQYTIESYEDLAVLRTVNSEEGIVELIIAPDFADDVEQLLGELTKEIPMEEICVKEPPPTWNSLKEVELENFSDGEEI